MTFGTPVGLTTYISQEKENLTQINVVFRKVLLLLFVFSLSLSIVFTVFSGLISEGFLGVTEYNLLFNLIILSSPFLVLFTIIESYLKGLQNLNLLIKINVLSATISIVLLYPFIFYFGFNGVGLYYFLFSLIPILLYIYLEKGTLKTIYKVKSTIDKKIIYGILKIGSVSLLSSFLFQISLLQLRKFIIVNFDANFAGLYQSLLALSMNYFILIFSFLSMYTLPKISSIKTNEEVNSELNEQFRFILFIMVPMILVILTFRFVFIHVFYTSEFVLAGDWFYIQIIGDFFKSLGALFSIWLIPRMRIKVLMIIDISFNAVLIFSPYILLSLFPSKFIIIPIAYSVAYFIHFSLTILYTFFHLNFRFKLQSLKIFILSIITLIGGIVINYYFTNLAYYIIFILIVIYSVLVLEKDEVVRIKKYLRAFKQ